MNSERDTIKNCALFLLACTTADTSKENEREDWPGENVKSVDALHMCCLTLHLYFLSEFQMPDTRAMCCPVEKQCALYSVCVFTAAKGS